MQRNLRLTGILLLSIFATLVGCTIQPTALPTPNPNTLPILPTQVIPTWSESDLTNYDPSPTAVLLEADDYYMITDPDLICNRFADVRIWGDGRVIIPRFIGNEWVKLEGHLSPQQIEAALKSLQDLGFTGAYTPEEIVPAPVSYDMEVNLKSGTVSRSWNYRPPLVDQFLRQLPLAEFSAYVPKKALFLVKTAGEIDTYPEWPSALGLSLSSVPPEGIWVQGEVLNFLWHSANNQGQIPPGFRSAGKYYAVRLEIPELALKNVSYKCW